jgi:PhzF family phenazine biosynthesis protein
MASRAPTSASYNFVTLDVFTETRYEGNPLALVNVPKDSTITQEQKQVIAREFNFSETVFLHEDVGAAKGRRLDIFLPTHEIPFAGGARLFTC